VEAILSDPDRHSKSSFDVAQDGRASHSTGLAFIHRHYHNGAIRHASSRHRNHCDASNPKDVFNICISCVHVEWTPDTRGDALTDLTLGDLMIAVNLNFSDGSYRALAICLLNERKTERDYDQIGCTGSLHIRRVAQLRKDSQAF
jgi:hypothetical protein